MMGFFKKLFKPKEESVQFSQLSDWLDNHNDGLKRVNHTVKEIKQVKDSIAENLKTLGEVDISQAKVEDRVKNIVKGNLPAYINALKLFLKRVSPPEDINHFSLDFFYKNFENDFEDLNKKTFRNFQIIRELVGKELEGVAKSVKHLEILMKEIKKDSAQIKKVSELKEKVEFIQNSIGSKEENKKKREEFKKEKEDLIDSCERLKKEIENLKKSKKVKELEELKLKEKKVSDSIRELEHTVLTLFSSLQKALKKYNNLCFIKKVDSYIESPIETLFKDAQLEILKFLKDIGKMIEEKKIDLKEDKKKKTIESLEQLNESFIKNFIKEHNSLNEKLSSIRADINKNNVHQEISDLEKEFNIKNFKIENVERNINKIKDVNIDSEIKELEDKLEKIFSLKVNIENVMG